MRWAWLVVLAGCADDTAGEDCTLVPQDIDVEVAPLVDRDVGLTLDDWLGFQRAASGRLCGIVDGSELVCVRDGVTSELGPVGRDGLPLVRMAGDDVHVVARGEGAWSWTAEGREPVAVPDCLQVIGLWLDASVPRVLCDDFDGQSLFLSRVDGEWRPRVVDFDFDSYPITANVPANMGGGFAYTATRDVDAFTEPNPRHAFVVIEREADTLEIPLVRNDAFQPLDLVFDRGEFTVLGVLLETGEVPRVVMLRGDVRGGAVRRITVDGQALPDIQFISGRMVVDRLGRVHAAWFQHSFSQRAVGYAMVGAGDAVERVTYSESTGSLLGGRFGERAKMSVVSLVMEDDRPVARGVLIDTDDGQPKLATLRLPGCDATP